MGNSPSWRDIAIGFFVGCFIVAPFIWTALGRELTKKAIAKGAKVTASKVEEWAKIGEES
jgi:hypothetical protein